MAEATQCPTHNRYESDSLRKFRSVGLAFGSLPMDYRYPSSRRDQRTGLRDEQWSRCATYRQCLLPLLRLTDPMARVASWTPRLFSSAAGQAESEDPSEAAQFGPCSVPIEGSQRVQTGPVIGEYVKSTRPWTPGRSSVVADQAGAQPPRHFHDTPDSSTVKHCVWHQVKWG